MTLQEMIEKVPELTPEEQAQLMGVLAEQLASSAFRTKPHSLSELRGLGAHIWQDIDAQEYVNQLRDRMV